MRCPPSIAEKNQSRYDSPLVENLRKVQVPLFVHLYVCRGKDAIRSSHYASASGNRLRLKWHATNYPLVSVQPLIRQPRRASTDSPRKLADRNRACGITADLYELGTRLKRLCGAAGGRRYNDGVFDRWRHGQNRNRIALVRISKPWILRNKYLTHDIPISPSILITALNGRLDKPVR